MMNFKKLLLVFACLGAGTVAFAQTGTTMLTAMEGDLPPNAIPGKCYARCLAPDQYATETEQILVKEASSRLELIPPTYETVTEQVLVKEAYKVLEVVPATFTTTSEEIMVKEPSKRLEYVPPVYETATEQKLIAPATTQWTKGRADRTCLQNEADPDKCRVWCLTEVPAQYKTVTRQVLKSPANTRETPIPAEYKTITKAVVQTPAATRERDVPAEYRSITKQVQRTPASTCEVPIPPEYNTITTRKLARPGGFTEWVEVVCEDKVTTSKIRQIQDALRARGYDPVPSDDQMVPRTREALAKFQRENNLPEGNLNTATMNALGVQ